MDKGDGEAFSFNTTAVQNCGEIIFRRNALKQFDGVLEVEFLQ